MNMIDMCKKNLVRTLLRIYFATIFSTIVFTQVYAQNIDDNFFLGPIDNQQSIFNFYQGVSLLNSGYIGESITAFQKSLSVENLPVYQYMFARANNLYGLKNEYYTILESLVNSRYLESLLRNEIEFSKLKYSSSAGYSLNQMVRNSSLDVSQYGYKIPVSIRLLPNGNIAVVFLQSGDIVLFNPSGKVVSELSSGLTGIQYPTDLIYTSQDRLLVSTFGGDNVFSFSMDGNDKRHFFNFKRNATTAPADVKNFFIGPQGLAEDEEGNIYITAYGSGRVFKFSAQGEYLFNFGQDTNLSDRLSEPTSIGVLGDTVIVSDYKRVSNNSPRKSSLLYMFDLSGNFIKSQVIVNDRIESLRKIDDNTLLLTTPKRILKYSISESLLSEEFAQSDFSRLMSATQGKNDILWVVDQDRNRLETFARLERQYAGTEARILSINANNFPSIEIDFRIESVYGTRLVGLDKDNFTLYEKNSTVPIFTLTENAQVANTEEQVILIPSNQSFLNEDSYNRLYESVKILTNQGQDATLTASKKVNFWFLEPNAIPEYAVESSSFSALLLNALDDFSARAKNTSNFLSAFRFAINTLLPLRGEKTIVFLGRPSIIEDKNTAVLWAQIRHMLEINYISVVWIDDTLVADQYEGFVPYLKDNKSTNVFIKSNYADTNILQTIFAIKDEGRYTIRYRSQQSLDSLSKFVPVELEVSYFSSSDKDVLGYILPSWER